MKSCDEDAVDCWWKRRCYLGAWLADEKLEKLEYNILPQFLNFSLSEVLSSWPSPAPRDDAIVLIPAAVGRVSRSSGISVAGEVRNEVVQLPSR